MWRFWADFALVFAILAAIALGFVPGTAAAAGGPTAVIVSTPNPFACGQSVRLDGTLSTPGNGSITAYAWDLTGNGTTDATGATVTHTFSQDAMVTLTVTDSSGTTATAQQLIKVLAGTHTPSADVGGPYAVVAGDSLVLDGSGSTDPDVACGDTLTYAWSVNGLPVGSSSNPTLTVPWNALSAAVTPLHLSGPAFYLGGSTYLPVPVELTVTDATGRTDSATTTLTPHAGQIHFRKIEARPSDVDPNVPFTFTADAIIDDPSASIVSYTWGFGDGSASVVTIGATSQVTHTYAAAKLDPVSGTPVPYAVTVQAVASTGLLLAAPSAVQVMVPRPRSPLMTSGSVLPRGSAARCFRIPGIRVGSGRLRDRVETTARRFPRAACSSCPGGGCVEPIGPLDSPDPRGA